VNEISSSRKQIEKQINDCKYDLMVLTQDLGKIVPSSELAGDLVSKSKYLQEKIDKLENELQRLDSIPIVWTGEFEKVVSAEGEVKTWTSERKSQS
jgi:RNase H-fold protein (predicted Holliday junction resolvase)